MENRFMSAAEVAKELGVSKSYGYKIVRILNDELKEKGFLTISGKISSKYFYERLYGMEKEEKEYGST